MNLGPNQQAFVDALRATDKVQGREYLETRGGEFCALGILCLTYEEQTSRKVRREHGRIFGTTLMSHLEVARWAGFYKDADRDISIQNDRGSSFDDIAHRIETSPQYYFSQSI